MTDKKNKNEKLTIDAYKKLIAERKNNRFKIEFYPWPVMVALGVPFATFIFLIIVYILHIKNIAG